MGEFELILGGCNHMTCGLCSYEFCRVCMRKYEKDHYTDGLCKKDGKWFDKDLNTDDHLIKAMEFDDNLMLEQEEVLRRARQNRRRDQHRSQHYQPVTQPRRFRDGGIDPANVLNLTDEQMAQQRAAMDR